MGRGEPALRKEGRRRQACFLTKLCRPEGSQEHCFCSSRTRAPPPATGPHGPLAGGAQTSRVLGRVGKKGEGSSSPWVLVVETECNLVDSMGVGHDQVESIL